MWEPVQVVESIKKGGQTLDRINSLAELFGIKLKDDGYKITNPEILADLNKKRISIYYSLMNGNPQPDYEGSIDITPHAARKTVKKVGTGETVDTGIYSATD